MSRHKPPRTGPVASGEHDTDPLAGIPEPPADFIPREIEPTSARGRGMAALKTYGVDDSGPRKLYPLVRVVKWAMMLRGGSFLKAGRNHEAAAAWKGTPSPILKARLDAAVSLYDERHARNARYKRAGLQLPDPAWERQLYEAGKAKVAAQGAWDDARNRVETLAGMLTDQLERFDAALIAALCHVEDRLGGQARACVEAAPDDMDFLAAFPAHAPDTLIEIYEQAASVNALIFAQDQTLPDTGMDHFWRSCGDAVKEITEGKVEAGRSAPREAGPAMKADRVVEATLR